MEPNQKLTPDLNKLRFAVFVFIYISIWFFFLEHLGFIGHQGNWEDVSVTPLYHFNQLEKHLGISWVITTEHKLLTAKLRALISS